ncbi:uncharacterized protein LAESUDRAFT_646253 [Laetiporus sulphureus 93-53]|uniref:Uncharacterized protein n=1 Tax=Laetiporus sulphureus 93-53 TaxID=1314785 RepID=A0A165FXG8_9APHY|nr:uncharacterized protein LAESUDRAFT_646253 [Laetiporus sulphureus 93-53]KZT09544.1 hypothetical protein LAESUDRAFT_646253 [Laetiporus sulphureus 93-53]
MTSRPQTFTKVDLTPRRHHGYAILLCIMGTLFPPLAVAARFGIGSDFFLNLLLTICGYIPGHVHNFYIQNIRNNKNHRRTPKWVQRYGLVDTSEIRRKERRSQWANRYNERLPSSSLRDQPYAQGEIAGSNPSLASNEGGETRPNASASGEFWNRSEEHYYGANGDRASVESTSTRWRYPANFEDATPPADGQKKNRRKKKDKKDRWARTEDAYSIADTESGTHGRKSKKKSRTATVDSDTWSHDPPAELPEDPEGGFYAEPREEREDRTPTGSSPLNDDDILNQEV